MFVATWTPYAQRQLNVDALAKEAVADWAVRHLGIRDNSGLFLDAGSQNLEVWKCLRTKFEGGDLQHLLVVTNSFLVLRDWVDQLKNPQALNLRVRMVGTEFNGPHLAFYGVAEQNSALVSKWFRPWIVFIGASGIGFDPDDGILLGHIGERERSDKQLLFQCQCQYARVILATPRKIGNPGGEVIDILAEASGQNSRSRAPIFLISTEPAAESAEEKLFKVAVEQFQSPKMKKRIEESGVRVRWFVVGGAPPGEVKLVREIGPDQGAPALADP